MARHERFLHMAENRRGRGNPAVSTAYASGNLRGNLRKLAGTCGKAAAETCGKPSEIHREPAHGKPAACALSSCRAHVAPWYHLRAPVTASSFFAPIKGRLKTQLAPYLRPCAGTCGNLRQKPAETCGNLRETRGRNLRKPADTCWKPAETCRNPRWVLAETCGRNLPETCGNLRVSGHAKRWKPAGNLRKPAL